MKNKALKLTTKFAKLKVEVRLEKKVEARLNIWWMDWCMETEAEKGYCKNNLQGVVCILLSNLTCL